MFFNLLINKIRYRCPSWALWNITPPPAVGQHLCGPPVRKKLAGLWADWTNIFGETIDPGGMLPIMSLELVRIGKECPMAIQEWSDDIVVVELADDPQFTDELTSVTDLVERNPRHVVLNFGVVGFINSSNVAKLLRLRKAINMQGRKLIMCEVNTQVWGVFLVTGLDKIFDFTSDTATALATLQIG